MALIAPYDPTRFTSAIPHYVNGRPAYAERLIAKLAREAGLDARSRVLDLGCGPGSLTLPISRYCGTTIGIDADPAMIATAAQSAKNARLDIEWRVGSSFDLDAGLAPLNLVTIARAFHWMDRAQTLRDLDAIVASDGALALFGDDHPNTVENAWRRKLREICDRYGRKSLPHVMAAADHGFRGDESLLLDSSFPQLERAGVFVRRQITIEEVVWPRLFAVVERRQCYSTDYAFPSRPPKH